MLRCLLVFEVTVANSILNSMPYGAQDTTILFYFSRRKLPGEIDTIKIIVQKESMNRVDKFGSQFCTLDLSTINHFTKVNNQIIEINK